MHMRARAVESLPPNARAVVDGAVLADGHVCMTKSGAELFVSPSAQLLLDTTTALDLSTGVLYDMRLYSEGRRRPIEPQLGAFCGPWCLWSWSYAPLLSANSTTLVSQSFGPYDCRLTLKSQTGMKRPRLLTSSALEVLITTLDSLIGVVIFARLQGRGTAFLTRDSCVAKLGVVDVSAEPLRVELMWRK
jgi:hypothetical protein